MEDERYFEKIFHIVAVIVFVIFVVFYVCTTVNFKMSNELLQKNYINWCLPVAVGSFIATLTNMIECKTTSTLKSRVLNIMMIVFPTAFIFVSILILTK